MGLLDIHHGLMAASRLVQAINGVVAPLFVILLIWLAWQILFCSDLRGPRFRLRSFRLILSFYPDLRKWRQFHLLPYRVPDDWVVYWLWFQVRWEW